MRRVIYISGRYRIKRPDGSWDKDAMLAQIHDETYWAKIVADAGHAWIAPLHNSIMLEGLCSLTGDEYVERDLHVIRRLHANYDAILMRPGWDKEPQSKGASDECATAQQTGLLVIHALHGPEQLRQYLKGLSE